MQQPNPHQIVRNKVTELLGRLPKDSVDGRQKVYDQLRGLFDGRYPDHRAMLERAIAEIERDMAPATGQPTKSGRRSRMVIKGFALAVVVAASAAWYQFVPHGTIQDFDHGVTGYTANLETLLQIPARATNYISKSVGWDDVIELRGQSSIFTIDPIEVNPAKRYIVRARIRVTEDDPSRGGAEFNVGVATFDADGKLQTSAPGTHRYAAAAARVLKVEDGWVDLEGEITGAGNKSRNQFREGTTTVRLAAFFNYRSPKAVSQITSFSIEEVPSEFSVPPEMSLPL